MIETKALTEKLGLNKETAKRIKSLEQGLIKVLTEATLKAFKIGEILYMVEANNSKGRQAFVDWVTKDLKISWQTCLNYKKLFVFFYQDPERLENLTIMQAYAEALRLKKPYHLRKKSMKRYLPQAKRKKHTMQSLPKYLSAIL
ncbi:hypothetical protein [Treponema phagedenis]|uniref:hypothetical protein n=1 Tax=Treponema phagedenis TaxID=162 RepID=UPI0015A4753A|nr:hypothetical protein [Treponema phagedenis]NVP25435.1 hypothetical protein [Treponema phagedenis]QLC57557.1 hypothetical protein HW453_01035 [Treponema phagedenis]